jgi:fumarylpyruvate hydrolase
MSGTPAQAVTAVIVAPTVIPVVGTADTFPVRRVYCIGRNDAGHAREMGSDPTCEPPFFFRAPADTIQNATIGTVTNHPYPSRTKNYHYEVELVAALKSGERNIPKGKALDHIFGYALGLGMTRRDLHCGPGDQKKPWETGTSFDMSAPIGPVPPVEKIEHFVKEATSLAVNGAVKQNAGDIIYSEPPKNVGSVVKGDVILCKIEGLPDPSVKIV